MSFVYESSAPRGADAELILDITAGSWPQKAGSKEEPNIIN